MSLRRTIGKVRDLVAYLLHPPSRSQSDTAAEKRRLDIRRAFSFSIAKLDRVESLYRDDSLNEASSLSRELVQELGRLVCVLHDISPERSIAAGVEDGPVQLPDGELREPSAALLENWRAVEVSTSASERRSAIKALITAAVALLDTAEIIFRKKQKEELHTPMDDYRRWLVGTVVGLVAFIAATASAVYVFYRMSLPRITIVEATFGDNCNKSPSASEPSKYSVLRGNVTGIVAAACDNSHPACELSITTAGYGDPAPLCAKELTVTWLCSDDPGQHVATIGPEATGKVLSLTCGNAQRITIQSATYGANCDGKPDPNGDIYAVTKGNRTAAIARRCNLAEETCIVDVGFEQMADPAPFCAKEFEVVWSCSQDGKERVSRIAAEAFGKTLVLACR